MEDGHYTNPCYYLLQCVGHIVFSVNSTSIFCLCVCVYVFICGVWLLLVLMSSCLDSHLLWKMDAIQILVTICYSVWVTLFSVLILVITTIFCLCVCVCVHMCVCVIVVSVNVKLSRLSPFVEDGHYTNLHYVFQCWSVCGSHSFQRY